VRVAEDYTIPSQPSDFPWSSNMVVVVEEEVGPFTPTVPFFAAIIRTNQFGTTDKTKHHPDAPLNEGKDNHALWSPVWLFSYSL